MRFTVPAPLRGLGYGVVAAYADYRAMFTWRSWLFGWLLRLLCQVMFFATLGRLVGSPGTDGFLAVGNAAVLASFGTLGVVSSTVAERRGGTLQFLLLSRADPYLVMASRGLYWVADGMITAMVALCALPLLTARQVHYPGLPVVFAIELLMAASTYQLALALCGVSLRWPESRTYLTAGVTIVILALCGVNFPTPADGFAHAVAQVLPVSHAMPALRAAVDGAPVPMAPLAGELLVAAGWGLLGYLSLTWSLRHSVRAGTLALH